MTDVEASALIFTAIQKRVRQKAEIAGGLAVVVERQRELQAMQVDLDREIGWLDTAFRELTSGHGWDVSADKLVPRTADEIVANYERLLK